MKTSTATKMKKMIVTQGMMVTSGLATCLTETALGKMLKSVERRRNRRKGGEGGLTS